MGHCDKGKIQEGGFLEDQRGEQSLWYRSVEIHKKPAARFSRKAELQCEGRKKTINHLFLHCKVTSQLWNLFHQPQRCHARKNL